jgi:hypothetical protein
MLDFDPKWGHDIKAGELELKYPLTTVNITENKNAISNICHWVGTIDHSDLSAGALTESLKFLDAIPQKYKILEIMVDNTEKWDDGGGPISACTLSIGWTGANYDDLIQTQDIYTAISLIGDAAGELNYTAVQGGIHPNWSGTTDLYAHFIATGGNIDTLLTGKIVVYISYLAYE